MLKTLKKLSPLIALVSVSVLSLNLFSPSVVSFSLVNVNLDSLFSIDVNLGDLCPESPPVVIINSQVEPMETNRISGTVPVFAHRPSVSWERSTGHEWWTVLHNLVE